MNAVLQPGEKTLLEKEDFLGSLVPWATSQAKEGPSSFTGLMNILGLF